MLKVEERFMIKEMAREGVSISEIARRSGRDRKTVRRILSEPLIAERQPRRKQKKKLDPYIPYLQKRIAAGVLNAQKLYEEIRKQGYQGKDRQVRYFVRPYREPQQPQATLRFETEPGEQGQVDWAHFGTINHHGRNRRLYAFVLTLGWSRAMYLEFTVSMQAMWFLRGHVHAFEYFNGLPRKILHDNLKTAVVDRDEAGRIIWNRRYLDFAAYYGFSPRACQPYRAQTKGKVENGVKYVRGNFWPGIAFSDLADLNRQAMVWLNTVANVRLHGTTQEVPFDRLAEEPLTALPLNPYDTALVSYRRCSRDCFISYCGNFYSIPALYASQQVMVKETEQEELVIFTLPGDEIARHTRSYGHKERISQAEHYHSLRPKKVPAKQEPTPQTAPRQFSFWDAPDVQKRPLSIYEAVVG